jgi:2-haloacid dehalogenase
MNPAAFDVLTFDIYGTIIDWETGILAALEPVFAAHGVAVAGDALLEAYAPHEAAVEAERYRSYREVLAETLRRLGEQFGFTPSPQEIEAFSGSVRDWPPLPDSAAALAALKRRYKLAPITNCDDDLVAMSVDKLDGVTFDWIITAEQVGSYKPNPRNFQVALERIGADPKRVLHVAQSLFHDHVPAKRLGLTTVWINRRHDKEGSGATPPADADPDYVLRDLASLAARLVPN